MVITNQQSIKQNLSFFKTQGSVVDVFNKVRVGNQTLNNIGLDLGDLQKTNSRLANKETILDTINNRDLKTMREISNFFYRTSGIYSRLCRHMAYFYRYDWFVIPHIRQTSQNQKKKDKLIAQFQDVLSLLDSMELKMLFGEIALGIMRDGAYYGYRVDSADGIYIQELPVNYCRSRFKKNGRPVVEMSMKFFDDNFYKAEDRLQVLKIFPKEISKAYLKFKNGQLDREGWYILDTELAFKFNLNGEDYPPLISVVPGLIDLDEAKDLEKKKAMQNLLKIIIQKLPMNKDNELIFDADEARDIHIGATRMLGKSIGMDVLTTVAEIEVADMSDKPGVNAKDYQQKAERSVFNESGTAQNLFNTDGNLALEKSVLNDEASLYSLILQFESFLNSLVKPFNKKPKEVVYKVEMLSTTIYNYKEMSKLFKEQTQLGYSKMLPQIALGQPQSAILATAFFENDFLNLVELFIPPKMSSTMGANDGQKNVGGNRESSGRKEKPDDQKSEKTIANREAMGKE